MESCTYTAEKTNKDENCTNCMDSRSRVSHSNAHSFLFINSSCVGVDSCWYMFQNMGKAPSARFGHTMTPIGSKLYIIGGERTDTSIKQDDSLTIHILDNGK